MNVANLWPKDMKNNFLSSVSSKVVAWGTLLATGVAIVTAMTMFDDRYARAADVYKAQAAIVQSIKLLNVDIQLQGLKNRQLELKSEKRNLAQQVAIYPNNVTLKNMLEEANSDLVTVNRRIGELRNKKVIE